LKYADGVLVISGRISSMLEVSMMTDYQHRFVRDVVGVRRLAIRAIVLAPEHIRTIFQTVSRSEISEFELDWFDVVPDDLVGLEAVVAGVELLRGHTTLRTFDIGIA